MREAAARSAAKLRIASLMEQAIVAPGEAYGEMEKRIARSLEPLYQMNALQLRVFVEELRDFPIPEQPWDGRWYQEAVGVAITALAATDPGMAMAFLAENDGLEEAMSDSHDRVIGIWAMEDPMAALAWMRENPTKVSRDGREALLRGLANRDPVQAFQFLLEFEMYDLRGDGAFEGSPDFTAAKDVARAARTLEDRSAVFGILRGLNAAPGEDPDNIRGLIVEHALPVMGREIGAFGYERATAWLDSLDLRPGEAAQLLRDMAITDLKSGEDTGRWIQWMGGHLSSGEFERVAGSKIGDWVQYEPQAAEKWLAQAADGPAKRAVASSLDYFAAWREREAALPSAPARGFAPVATAVEGHPSMVKSPFNVEGENIDVTGVPSGTLIVDPQTPPGEKKRYFRVP